MKYIKELKIKEKQLPLLNDVVEINKLELSFSSANLANLIMIHKKAFLKANNFLSILNRKYSFYFNNEEKEEIIKKIISNPEISLNHAISLQERFPEGEKTILKNPIISSLYAQHVIKNRWIEAEPIIVSNGKSATNYSINILKKSWYDSNDIDLKIRKEAENNIIKDCEISDLILYAINAKKRWIEMKNIDKDVSLKIEKKIFKNGDGDDIFNYIKNFINTRVKEAELQISKNPRSAYYYAEKILKKPWHEIKDINPEIINMAENSLTNQESLQDFISIDYAKNLIKGRWKKLEDVLIANRNNNFYFDIIDNYYQKIIGKDGWPEMDRYADEEYEEVI